jgi:asparagine synthase (glutamine-hydrolysing)
VADDAVRGLIRCLPHPEPDGQREYSDGPVSMGIVDFRTALDRPLDGQVTRLRDLVVVADVRLDERTELVRLLRDASFDASETNSDEVLLLRAYAAWGKDCVEHLRGDFSFAIWDGGAQTLFCARDHFGIKPFYYAAHKDTFVFASTLRCVKGHASVTNEVNEQAVGDFLLFGLNYNTSTTFFRDICRLPAAHCLSVSSNALTLHRYWAPPSSERIRYARHAEYVEHFNDILARAVSDRLTSDPTVILLSGGLDSGAIAGSAKKIAADRGGIPEIRSCTFGHDAREESDEGRRGQKLAAHLGIPNTYVGFGQVELFERASDPQFRLVEPIDNPLASALFAQWQQVAREGRVALNGEGPDNLLYFQMYPYLMDLWNRGERRRAIRETVWFLGVRPLPWKGAAHRLSALLRGRAERTRLPRWIAPAFAKRMGLEERYRDYNQLRFPTERHAARPKAHASMFLPQWSNLFESSDPGVTQAPVEVRYPFLDLRVVNYLLAIPTFPWAYRKNILRKAMGGALPESIVRGKKIPLAKDPVVEKLRVSGDTWKKRWTWGEQVCEFVVPPAAEDLCGSIAPEDLRPFILDSWLKESR